MSIATQAQTDGFHLSAEIEAVFIEVGTLGRRTLERLYDGFTLAFNELVERSSEPLTEKGRHQHFKNITDRACQLAVKVSEGGGAAKGISRDVFNKYVNIVKRTFEFDVTLDMAEDLNLSELRQTRDYRNRKFEESKGRVKITAEGALVWLRKQQADQKRKDEEVQKQREEAAKVTAETAPTSELDSSSQSISRPDSKTAPTSKTSPKVRYTVPVIADYDTTDEGTFALLKAISKFQQEFFQDEGLQPHLAKGLELATVYKEFLAKLVALDQRHSKKISEKKTGTA